MILLKFLLILQLTSFSLVMTGLAGGWHKVTDKNELDSILNVKNNNFFIFYLNFFIDS